MRTQELVVYASLTDTGKYLRAYVIVKNDTENKYFDLDSNQLSLDILSPKLKHLPAMEPRKVIKRLLSNKSELRGEFLSTMGASLSTPASLGRVSFRLSRKPFHGPTQEWRK